MRKAKRVPITNPREPDAATYTAYREIQFRSAQSNERRRTRERGGRSERDKAKEIWRERDRQRESKRELESARLV